MRKNIYSGFKGKKVFVTGGLGFIGSNLAIKLISLGAKVTLLDVMLPDHGGNLFNIEPVRDKVTINFSDIRDKNSMITYSADRYGQVMRHVSSTHLWKNLINETTRFTL